MRRVSLAARRASRYLRRPPKPRWWQPARTGLAVAAGLVLAGGLIWWADRVDLGARASEAVVARVLDLTAAAGLRVSQVYVDGRSRADLAAVREAVGVEPGDPLLGLDLAAIKARLEQLTWVERASASRLFPDAVRVQILEREPIALWQRQGRFALVDRSGGVIEGVVSDRASAARYGHLRVLVGDHAPERAVRLFVLLSTEPELWARVAAATWVGERRWSVHLDNGIEVLLPEDRVIEAWRFLAAKAREDALLERAIRVVDLRFLPERLRLQLDPAALEQSGA